MRQTSVRARRAPHASGLGWLATLLGLFCALVAASTRANLGTAVEYYNPASRHYFITAFPNEQALLDEGITFKGWVRTGGQFSVFTDPAEGLSAVCRFFGTPVVGVNSHFYTSDAAECAQVKTQPAWTFEAVAFYMPAPVNGKCGGNYPIYRSFYSDNVADANHRFTTDLTAHVRMTKRGDVLEGVVMCAPVTGEELEADVVRFLEQATLGPTEALVQEVKAKGIAAWLDEQLPMNVTRYTQYPYAAREADPARCRDDDTPPVTPEKYCNTNTQQSPPVAWEFYRQSRTAPDQVRLRMAHLWHEIFVAEDYQTYGHANFQQRLRDGVFDTFEKFLLSYTISPHLGKFQTWVGNVPEHDGIKPNENYARELMQLMSIGVSQLNEDGTLKLDANRQPIATYGQADIGTLARILTGYFFPPLPAGTPPAQFTEYYVGDMVPSEETWAHDQGAKSALGGRVQFAAGGRAAVEVPTLIRILANHPNTPPFIVKQLIQKTVTSSPTPGYVSRVVAVFKENGKGVRGDLAAVTRAILLDPEARGARKIDTEYGRLREPALFWTGMIRAFDINTDGYEPYQQVIASGQRLFQPLTVFGYYPADYMIAGGDVPGPEFGIFGSAEFINRANQVTGLLYNANFQNQAQYWGPKPFVRNAVGTLSPSLAAFLPDAADTERLVSRVDRLLLHGTMKPDTRNTIVNAVNKIAPAQTLARARLAINLVLVSIDYQVQK